MALLHRGGCRSLNTLRCVKQGQGVFRILPPRCMSLVNTRHPRIMALDCFLGGVAYIECGTIRRVSGFASSAVVGLMFVL